MAHRIKMPHPLTLAVTSGVASTMLSYFAPQYLLKSSPWWTGVALFWSQFLPLVIWATFLYPTFFSPLRHLPGPPGRHPLLGNMKEIHKGQTGFPHRRWLKTIPHNGILRYYFYFNIERVVPVSSKAIAEVLVTKSYDFIKPPLLAQNLGRMLGPLGILFSEGDVHRAQRKMLNPAFTFRHIKDLYPLFWSKSQELVTKVEAELEEAKAKSPEQDFVVHVEDWFSRATLDIIGAGGLSRSFGAIQDPNSELNTIYRGSFRPSRGRQFLLFLNILIPFWFINYLPLAANKRVNNAASAIRAKCQEFVSDKRAQLEKEKHLDATSSSSSSSAGSDSELSVPKSNTDILSIALKAGGFTDASLVDQLMTFLAAGHETTATAMTWALYTLCEHPEMQARLRRDLEASNLPSPFDESSSIAPSDVESIPYLQAFTSELLRYHPPVPFTSRVAGKDTSIQGQPIPKGTSVVLVPMAINRCEDFWGPDAETFNPDRWISSSPDGKPMFNGNGGAESNYSMMTFLHGPRSCIGERFARAEFMCLLAAWVLAFDCKPTWETGKPSDDVEVDQGVTRRIRGGVAVKLTKAASASS